jgi:transcriptional regulator with XRE-family HTH domain
MVTLPVLLSRLAPLVRARRKQAGYSQERFASAVGVHRTYMGSLERGQAPNPTLKVLDAIARRLGLDLMEMLNLAITGDWDTPTREVQPTSAPGSTPGRGPAATADSLGVRRAPRVRGK